MAVVGVTVVAAYLSYRFGTRRLLVGLQTVELSRQRAPELYRRLDRLVGEMDVRQPPVLVADLGVPNALSLGGPRKGVVVLDRSLLSTHPPVEERVDRLLDGEADRRGNKVDRLRP